MAFSTKNLLKNPSALEQLLEEINFQRTKEMRQLLKDDSGFVMLQGTTYWTDLFVRHFLFQNENSIDCDDLLFFVRKRHVKTSSKYLPKFETDVDVFRKDSKKLPIGDPDIDWEETVYLNLIIHQFDYTLTLAICTRTSPKELQVLRRHSQKVYASPSRRRMDTKGELEEMTYPHICFMVDNFDEVFCDILVRDGEMVCVELVASDRLGAIQSVIFLGSIRYDALKRVYDARQSSLSTKMAQRMTFGFFSNTAAQRCEFVRMKGPQGKGHAEMAVTKPKGSGVETPSSEPGFCLTDMWENEWESDPEDGYIYRHQRRLSDPSSNLNNFARGGAFKFKSMPMDGIGSRARSENEGLDILESNIAEIEAGDVKDETVRSNCNHQDAAASSSQNGNKNDKQKVGCCHCWRRRHSKRDGDSLSIMSEIYTQSYKNNNFPQLTFKSLISQIELGTDATQNKNKISNSFIGQKPLTADESFEFADDAVSLNDETFNDNNQIINFEINNCSKIKIKNEIKLQKKKIHLDSISLNEEILYNSDHSLNQKLNSSLNQLNTEKQKNKPFPNLELADDAISLDGDNINKKNKIISVSMNNSPLKIKNSPLKIRKYQQEIINSNDFVDENLSDNLRPTSKNSEEIINVNGKEELPEELIFQAKETKESDKLKYNLKKKYLNKLNDCSNDKINVVLLKRSNTLPKKKSKTWCQPLLMPPHKVTPDGTDIYYWCDLLKKNTNELDDGQYNPLWTMRGFTQTFHFWKENKRAQSVPLNAFLTYVTLPWWSIAKDILDHREEPILTF